MLFLNRLPGAIAVGGARYGQGTGPIFLDDILCRGNETRIVDCRSDGIAVHNCGHSEDAGAICKREEPTQQTNSVSVLFIVISYQIRLFFSVLLYIILYSISYFVSSLDPSP